MTVVATPISRIKNMCHSAMDAYSLLWRLLQSLHRFFTQRQVNQFVSWIFLVVSFYVVLISLLDLDFSHPFSPSLNTSIKADIQAEIAQSTVSLFFLVVFGLFVGQLFSIVQLPPLFGMLLVGIAFRNMPGVQELFRLNTYWSTCARKASLAVILLRLAVGLDTSALKKRPVLPITVGLGSIVCEAVSIAIASHFIFGLSSSIAIINGVLLAATSPAVVVPAFLSLQLRGLGVESGVPTLVLAGAALDNVVAISAFSIAIGIAFSSANLSETLFRYTLQLLVGAIAGIVMGLLLQMFPHHEIKKIHVWRVLLLSIISAAITFGCMAVRADAAGIIAVLLIAGVAASRWKKDNQKKTQLESQTFGLAWNVLFEPLLFTLVGMEFRFSILNWHSVGVSVAVLCIGVIVRSLSLIALTVRSGLSFKQRLLVSISFFSKATVQAALVTTVLTSTSGMGTRLEEEAKLVLVMNVLAIILTSPLGLVLVQFFGPRLLETSIFPSKKPSKTEPEPVITEEGDIEMQVPEELNTGKKSISIIHL